MDEQSERRLVENEVIFRRANEDAKDFVKDVGAANHVLVPFFCECSDPDCKGRIEMPVADYERIHQSNRQFVVLTGHEVPEIERVVQRSERYNIVEKTTSMPGDSAVDIALRNMPL